MITRDRQVRDATPVWEFFRQYVPKLKRHGDYATGLCPIHSEKTPSFRVHLAGKRKGTFKCFGCSARGDAIDMLSLMEGVSRYEALKRLAAEAGIPMDAPAESPEQRRARREEKAICDWWFDRRLKELRAEMGRLFWFGPPEPRTALYAAAVVLRDKIIWAERERGTERGLAVFRKAPVIEGAYRRWKKRREEIKRMYAGMTVMDWYRERVAAQRKFWAANWVPGPKGTIGDGPDPDEFVRKYGAEAYRRAIDNAVEIPMISEPGIMGA